MTLSPLWIRPNEGTRISPIGGDVTYCKLIGAQTGGPFAMLHQSVPPGHGPRRHVHTREEETFYILDGEFGFEVGDQTIVATQGDVVFGPRGLPHRFWNAGESLGRFLLIISPSGLEPFFTEYAEVIAKHSRNASEEEAVAAKYGISFV